MKKPFAKEMPAARILTHWWQELEHDKGARAELRRCDSPEEVMFQPAFSRLCHQLEPYLGTEWNWELRLAAVLGLLAHVRQASGLTLARQMAGTPPKVSELRFRRLLQRDRSELYGPMIRILRMLKYEANLPDLMDSVFYWGDGVRKRWALEYFSNTPETKTA